MGERVILISAGVIFFISFCTAGVVECGTVQDLHRKLKIDEKRGTRGSASEKLINRIYREDKCYHVETGHFLIRAYTKRGMAKDIAKNMEAVYEQFVSVFNFGEVMDVVTEVTVFKERIDYLRHTQKHASTVINSEAYWSQNSVFTWEKNTKEKTLAVLNHELAHGFLHRYIPSPPLWLDEGIAEYLEASRIKSRKLRGGYINELHLSLFHETFKEGRLLPLQQLVERDWSRREFSTLHYAESWALVYYLIHGEHGAYRKPFIDYLDALRRGTPARTAFSRLTPDIGTLESDWVDFMMRLRAGVGKVRKPIGAWGDGD